MIAPIDTTKIIAVVNLHSLPTDNCWYYTETSILEFSSYRAGV